MLDEPRNKRLGKEGERRGRGIPPDWEEDRGLWVLRTVTIYIARRSPCSLTAPWEVVRSQEGWLCRAQEDKGPQATGLLLGQRGHPLQCQESKDATGIKVPGSGHWETGSNQCGPRQCPVTPDVLWSVQVS